MQDLCALPRVGKANAQLLYNAGMPSCDALKEARPPSPRPRACGLLTRRWQHYTRECKFEMQQLDGFLRDEVKMRNSRDREELCKALHQMVLSGDIRDPDAWRAAHVAQPLTICVEGNISAGKTTFLEHIIADNAVLRPQMQLVPEPVDRWTSIPGMEEIAAAGANPEYNILSEFYKDPKRWGYTFQNWVFFTRFMAERDSAKLAAGRAASASAERRMRLMERSVFSDRLVFVEALQANQHMAPMELAMYKSWFEFMMADKPSLVPDGFIYLRASADTCHARMQRRARREEDGVPLNYLTLLHEQHEGWFIREDMRNPAGVARGLQHEGTGSLVLNLDGDREVRRLCAEFPGMTLLGATAPEALHEDILSLLPRTIRNNVVFLPTPSPAGRPGAPAPPLHRAAMARIPALILDCDSAADIRTNAALKDEYAQMVHDFYHFVGLLKSSLNAMPFGRPGLGAEAVSAKDLALLHQRIQLLSAEKLLEPGDVRNCRSLVGPDGRPLERRAAEAVAR